MRADQWEAIWKIIQGSWPASSGLTSELAKIEWASAFGGCDPRWLVDAIRAMAKETDRPTVSALTTWYADLSAAKAKAEHLERLTAGPVEHMDRMPDFEAQYQALDPEYRAEIEGQIKERYAGAYAGRNDTPNLRWAWACLVSTAEAKGIDPQTGGCVGDTSLSELAALEQSYDRNLAATKGQLVHEQSCAKCEAYSRGTTVATKANPLRERTGSPCAVGAMYYAPHYRQGIMERPRL